MSQHVRYEIDNGVAVITIDNPPVNALGHAVRSGLFEAFQRARDDASIGAVVLCAAGRTFPAGADVKEFGHPRAEPILSQVCALIEDMPKPIIAAIHGTALGGGFELALACHFRMADAGAKMGLPEVKLGVLPGGGGTQRLPRIIGADAALKVIMSGAPLGAQQAADMGLVDKVVQQNLDRAALKTAHNMVERRVRPRRTRDREEGFVDRMAYVNAVADWRKKSDTSPIPSVSCIVDCVENALLLPFENGVAFERQCFDDCETGPEATALRHAFFAERRAAKVPELKNAELRPVETIGVVGAGTMGTGIAISCLDAGFPVTLVERDEDSLTRGAQRIVANYDGSVAKGRINAATAEDRLSRLHGTTQIDELSKVDLVIEAVFEDEQVKKDVFAQLDSVMRPGAILATNTSYLDIDALARTISRPEDVVGYHFFSPAHIMKLLEIVVGEKTTADVVATGFALAKKLRKVPVRAGVADGFIGNRILAAYRLAADMMLEDGATPSQVDDAMREYGFPVGPYQVLDMAGLDISWARRKRLAETRSPDERYVAIGDRICERGWFGQKSGRGYYIHEDGKKARENPQVRAIIEEQRQIKGITPRSFSNDEIRERCLNAMANEGARLLEEGIALRPSDIDVALMYGYGFPRHHGGPMMAADQRGLLTVLNQLKSYKDGEPKFWEPSPLLNELIKNGLHFEDMNEG